MDTKLCFIDLETTGTDPHKHGVIQIGCIIETEGEERERFVLDVKPFQEDEMLDSAFEVNGKSREIVDTYPEPHMIHDKFVAHLDTYVDRFNRNDKFHFVGYNGKFDYDFLRAWFVKCGDTYFGSWFFWPPLDVANIAAFYYQDMRSDFNDFKLGTVAEHIGIDLSDRVAHDALGDIETTRDLYKHLVEGTLG